MAFLSAKKVSRKNLIQTKFETCMAEEDFRMISIFKIIIGICIKNYELRDKTSEFLPKGCLFIFYILLFK